MSLARSRAQLGFTLLGVGLASATPLGVLMGRGVTVLLGLVGYRYGFTLDPY